MRISDWSSDVCSSDLLAGDAGEDFGNMEGLGQEALDFARARDGQLVLFAQFIHAENGNDEIGRASCRERVCQYVKSSVVAVSLKKQKYITVHIYNQVDIRVTSLRIELTQIHNR